MFLAHPIEAGLLEEMAMFAASLFKLCPQQCHCVSCVDSVFIQEWMLLGAPGLTTRSKDATSSSLLVPHSECRSWSLHALQCQVPWWCQGRRNPRQPRPAEDRIGGGRSLLLAKKTWQ